MKKIEILFVDDEEDVCRAHIGKIARATGFNIRYVPSGREVLRIVEENPDISCIILDRYMPNGLDGLEVSQHLKNLAPHIPIILVSAVRDQKLLDQIEAEDHIVFARKGDTEEIVRLIRTMVHEPEELHIDESTTELFEKGNFVFRSESMRKVIHQAARLAKTNQNILITGETGVGKTKIVRFIHDLSARSSKPFEKFTSVAFGVTEQILASMLFGSVKGAFTGAQDNKGMFEAAGEGTLFLDEIGDLSLDIQTSLLEVLGDGLYRRLGGTMKPREIKCRLIFATNRNLEQEVHEQRFREDLWARISQAVIHIPPLRERTEDIPYLAQAFLEAYNKQQPDNPLRFGDGTLNFLRRQQWPRNVRQLENIVLRAAGTCTKSEISPADIVGALQVNIGGHKTPTPSPVSTETGAGRQSEPGEGSGAGAPRKSPAATLDEKIDECIKAVFDSPLAANLKHELDNTFRKRLIEESLRRTYGNVRLAERKYWSYSGKGGLVHWINKLGIDIEGFKPY